MHRESYRIIPCASVVRMKDLIVEEYSITRGCLSVSKLSDDRFVLYEYS